MQLFFTDQRKVWKVGQVAGLSQAELSALFARRLVPSGTPILLDEAMRPVEPVSSWFRSLALERKDAKTMRSYAYSVLMLLHFLLAREADLQSATETDLREFRLWRQDEAEEVVGDAAWDRDWAAIESLYRYLIRIGVVARQPWRATPQRDNLASRIRPDLRVRHMELDQYLYLRDVGFGGLAPDAGLDVSFRGWRPHRNRAACELALMTGMRIQEWSTLLLPELGLLDGQRPAFVDVELKACAKFGRPRSVYVGPDPMELLDAYLLLERPEIVEKAQHSLRRRHRELFVIQRLEADGTRVRGVLDGLTITRTIKNMKSDLRRLAAWETGGGLDPLALFIGQGGRMLTFSAWDKIRWRAWDRLKAWAGDRNAPVLPRRCWVYHDLRHTFALRLLIFLTREALNDAEDQGLPMSTLLDHMTGNPLLVVQRRLGHAHPSTTYRYIRYLKDPMREVDDAFREWTAAGGASYIAIARSLMDLEDAGHAPTRPLHP
ncbi:site-specific integrase [Streptomyces sp. TG1A-8]|uniref:tyrosine-type recombinase/integrase n=1 Tax=Streptomyces sp. TG1A-8 TaxID=3051385 RepID=UPI00265C8D1F|nr:site-specific integrase [Streptomyces sp. TG1A-8]MDO0923944.1 site-specific integrase [Streptomyces sp. TG1A-8]